MKKEEYKITILTIVIATLIICSAFLFLSRNPQIKEVRETIKEVVLGSSADDGTPILISDSSPGGTVISYGPSVLHKIIVGSTVTESDIAIYNNKGVDGNSSSNRVVRITLDDASGEWPINAYFNKGITAVVTNQSKTLFIWSTR